MGELKSFILDDKGLAPHVPDNVGHNGDLVIAYALAVQCLKGIRIKHFADPYTEYMKQKRINEIRNSDYAKHGQRYDSGYKNRF